MSHNAHWYYVYPDDETDHPHDEWVRADAWINGFRLEKTFSEAVSTAKLGAVNCRFPFIVQIMPVGGEAPDMLDCWLVTHRKKNNRYRRR